jgi:hypothetical protein
MAAYSAVPPDDPFAASRDLFAVLAAELAGPAATALTACQLEELLEARGREVLQDHFDLRQVREEQQARQGRAPATGTEGIIRTRLEAGHGRALATLFGTVRVTQCAWRKPGTANFCPADAALSLPAGRHSHSLAKLAAIEAARGAAVGAAAAEVLPSRGQAPRRRLTPWRWRMTNYVPAADRPGPMAGHARFRVGRIPSVLMLISRVFLLP